MEYIMDERDAAIYQEWKMKVMSCCLRYRCEGLVPHFVHYVRLAQVASLFEEIKIHVHS
jgi:hypothetical protein